MIDMSAGCSLIMITSCFSPSGLNIKLVIVGNSLSELIQYVYSPSMALALCNLYVYTTPYMYDYVLQF